VLYLNQRRKEMSNTLKYLIFCCILSSILVISGVVLLKIDGVSWRFILGLILILWANNIGLMSKKEL
jgi:hypothetical protein